MTKETRLKNGKKLKISFAKQKRCDRISVMKSKLQFTDLF